MSLLETIIKTAGPGVIEQLGSKLGLSKSQAATAVQHLMPVITKGIASNTQTQPDGLASLLGALTSGSHGAYLDNPQSLTEESAVQDGNAILGHVLGSKDASRAAAREASAQSGIEYDVLKKALPLVAAMTMGGLSKKADENKGTTESGFGDALGGILSGSGNSDAIGGLLGSLLS